VSNVQLIDPETKKPARVGYRLDEDNRKVRISRPGGKDI
jgi:large subunit ribosomal protein L24